MPCPVDFWWTEKYVSEDSGHRGGMPLHANILTACEERAQEIGIGLRFETTCSLRDNRLVFLDGMVSSTAATVVTVLFRRCVCVVHRRTD